MSGLSPGGPPLVVLGVEVVVDGVPGPPPEAPDPVPPPHQAPDPGRGPVPHVAPVLLSVSVGDLEETLVLPQDDPLELLYHPLPRR